MCYRRGLILQSSRIVKIWEVRMSESIYNARNLRAIGQDLEARRITQFELLPAADGYLVRVPYGAKKVNAAAETDGQANGRPASASSRPIELEYTLSSVERLDERGRAKRGSASGMPDFFSLSQCLRALGTVIDTKHGQLLQIDRKPQTNAVPSLIVQYQTSMGERIREEHSLPNLYDYCVHLYKTRRPIVSLPDNSEAVRTRMVN
jgi:hypothetical protein